MSKTKAKTRAQGMSTKSILASSMTLAIALTTTIAANGAPNSQTLTPEQSARKKAEYIRYERYVQAQLAKQDQSLKQQKLQQLAKRTAAEPKPDRPKTPHKHVPIQRQDVLLVMPAKGAKAADIKETIENAQGEICGRLGAGGLGVILVKAEPGKVVQLQRALAADRKNFKHVDFNTTEEPGYIPTTEPSFSKSWHLMRMRIPDAWDVIEKTNHFPQPVAVFDTGVEGPESWLSGWGADCTTSVGDKKIDDLGFDFDGILGTGLFDDDIEEQEKDIVEIGNNIKTLTYGCTDAIGHGTAVASVINGRNFNGKASAGCNPRVPVMPIKIGSGPKGKTDQLALVKAMCVMYDTLNTPIINISYHNLMDPDRHPILHEFFKDWYYRKNGLIFVIAGNNARNLSMKNQPYVVVVSGMEQSGHMKLAKSSGHGTAVDFTAPSQNIEVCRQDGSPRTINGTSFSTPLVAGVASMIWTVNPKLKNTEVEQILRESCDSDEWDEKFGWGMPDALKAVEAAAKR